MHMPLAREGDGGVYVVAAGDMGMTCGSLVGSTNDGDVTGFVCVVCGGLKRGMAGIAGNERGIGRAVS